MSAKHFLLESASILALGLMCSAAVAQEDATSNSDGLETVVVTGIRASLESAQAIKMHSEQVVDAITATDIGALPDRNVAEALQRVPGVTLQRNDAPNDLTRMGSTGTSVFVRGLAWIQTTLNGRDEFSAVNSRTLSFQDVSADLMSSVDVYKSPTAKMIEGGIGGVVDLKTRKPFDQDGRLFAVSGDLTYGDLADQARPSFNALYSDRWNTKIGEVGFLASVDWLDEHNRTIGINISSYDCWDSGGNQYAATDDGYSTCMDDDHVMAPGGWAWRQMEWKQQRLAGNAVVQWRPIESLEITLSAMNTYAHFTDLEHYVYMNQSTDYSTYLDPSTNTFGSTLKYDSNNNWLGGTTAMSSMDVRAGTGHNRTSDLNMNVKWNPSDSWEFSTDVQYVDSDRQYLNMTMYTGLNASLYMTLDVSSKNNPKITTYSTSADTTDPNNYFWYAAMDHMEYNSAHSFAERADATHTFGGDGLFGLIKSVDAGIRMQQKVAVTRSTGWNWGSIDPVNWGADGVTLAGNLTGSSYTALDGSTVTANSDAVQYVNSFARLFSYQKIFGNSVPSLWVPGDKLATMNPYTSSAILSAVNINWGGWQSYAAKVNCTNGARCLAAYDGSVDTGNAISPQDQNTYAAYIQANFGHDSLFGLDIPFDGNIGVRAVRTHRVVKFGRLVMPEAPTTSTGNCYDDLGNDMTTGDDSTMITSCSDYDDALAFWGDLDHAALSIDRPDAVRHNYTNILPSFNFRGHLSDQLQFRLGYSESMMQPEFSYTNNDATLSFNWGGQSTNEAYTMTSDPSGYGGNPNLKPMLSVNYDTSLEWYFSASGSITMSLFYKRISNYIYSQTYYNQSITNPYSGVSMDFDYTTYVNGAKGGVDGWELSYQQFYDMLPGFWSGFGLQANYTKIYNWGGHNGAVDVSSAAAISSANDTSLPMEGMSHDSYNVALLYAKYGIDARLAWNWRSEYLSATSDSNTHQPVWIEDYGQLDGSVFYTFLDHYKIGVQLYNITGATFYTDMGYADYHPRVNWIKSDRKYSLILRASW